MLDPGTGRFEHLRHDVAAPGSLASNQVTTLTRDHAGDLWVGTDQGTRPELAPGQQGFRHFHHVDGDPRTLSSNEVWQVLEDSSGSICVATTGGGGEPHGPLRGCADQVFRLKAGQPGSLASDSVQALLEDRQGHFWVGTTDGLDLLDRASGRSFTTATSGTIRTP